MIYSFSFDRTLICFWMSCVVLVSSTRKKKKQNKENKKRLDWSEEEQGCFPVLTSRVSWISSDTFQQNMVWRYSPTQQFAAG